MVYDSPFDNDYAQINTANLHKGIYINRILTAGKILNEKLIIN